MDIDIRIPVTADQKRLISEAVADEPAGMAAWARGVLIQAARERIAGQVQIVRPGAEELAFRTQLDPIYELSLAGMVHAAGDLIFDLVQGLLKQEDFPACDRLLSMVDVTRLAPASMITFLATTLTARDRLRAREAYFSRVMARLADERGKDRAMRLLEKYR